VTLKTCPCGSAPETGARLRRSRGSFWLGPSSAHWVVLYPGMMSWGRMINILMACSRFTLAGLPAAFSCVGCRAALQRCYASLRWSPLRLHCGTSAGCAPVQEYRWCAIETPGLADRGVAESGLGLAVRRAGGQVMSRDHLASDQRCVLQPSRWASLGVRPSMFLTRP
jgi:hypothetical protein